MADSGENQKEIPVRVCHYSDFSLYIPIDHKLVEYINTYPLYDRFLPHLCGYLPQGSLVLDVGANCGDTLAGMYSGNKALRFVCIDADDSFYQFLEFNVSRLRQQDAAAFVDLIKAFVGQGDQTSFLRSDGTTSGATGRAGDGQQVRRVPLDHLIQPYLDRGEQLSLVKIDVDGCDYEVITSGRTVLSSESPVVFFECHYDTEEQFQGYHRAIEWMRDNGYQSWVVFDNFGEIVSVTQDIGSVKQLLGYVWRQNKGRSHRTIYYYDILAFPEKHADVVNRAVEDYLAGNIKRVFA